MGMEGAVVGRVAGPPPVLPVPDLSSLHPTSSAPPRASEQSRGALEDLNMAFPFPFADRGGCVFARVPRRGARFVGPIPNTSVATPQHDKIPPPRRLCRRDQL